MTSTFGSRVRQLRRQQTMSQRDLAARACIPVSYLDRIERGHCAPPSCPTITALACALSVDWDELYALAGKMPFDIIHLLVRSPLLCSTVLTAITAMMRRCRTAMRDDIGWPSTR